MGTVRYHLMNGFAIIMMEKKNGGNVGRDVVLDLKLERIPVTFNQVKMHVDVNFESF